MFVAKRFTTWNLVHPKVFPVGGALIVLITFTIKDTWRDQVKDDLSSVESALTIYNLRADIEDTRIAILQTLWSSDAGTKSIVPRDERARQLWDLGNLYSKNRAEIGLAKFLSSKLDDYHKSDIPDVSAVSSHMTELRQLENDLTEDRHERSMLAEASGTISAQVKVTSDRLTHLQTELYRDRKSVV